MIDLNRRVLLTGAVAASAYACAKPVTAVPDDMSLGKANAPVTVIEYASVACPVCGKWYRDNFEAFKAKYITTGKVHYIAREMLVGDSTEESIAAAGFLLARCAGKDRYFAVTDAIYKNQTDVYADPRGSLLRIAQSMGMNESQFDACVKNEAQLQALDKRVQGYVTTDNVNSTPTFVINGKSMAPGYHTLAEIDAAIAAATPAH
jgi:protein-disulfide isomerase